MAISGRVAIVTGASAGIGYATAKLLAEKEAKLVLVARSKDKLEKLAEELPDAVAIPADMSKPDEVLAMIKAVLAHYGRIDILVNNAGQGYDAPVEKTNLCTLQYLFDLDVVGPVVAMKEAVSVMRMQGGAQSSTSAPGWCLCICPTLDHTRRLRRRWRKSA